MRNNSNGLLINLTKEQAKIMLDLAKSRLFREKEHLEKMKLNYKIHYGTEEAKQRYFNELYHFEVVRSYEQFERSQEWDQKLIDGAEDRIVQLSGIIATLEVGG